jgi:trk system potassium uptake protein TrkH
MQSMVAHDEMRIAGTLPAAGLCLHVIQTWVDPAASLVPAGAIPLAMVLAGFLITRLPVVGRLLATLAVVGWVVATLPDLLTSPAMALALWTPTLWLLTALWILPGLPALRGYPAVSPSPDARLARLRASLRITAALIVLVLWSRQGLTLAGQAAVATSLAISLGWALRVQTPRRLLVRRGLVTLALVLMLSLAAARGSEGQAGLALVLLMLVVLAASLVARRQGQVDGLQTTWWEQLLEQPARLLVATFLLLILLGTLLLSLPFAAADGRPPVAFVDAAFTSVSAVCVTGLIVLDTPNDWSAWGQSIILFLIQFGGLGIMSFATAFLSALGRRLSLRQEGAFAQLASGENRQELYGAVKTILGLTCVAEVLGMVALLPRFMAAGEPFADALWRSAFTAVSAFCNAGFALQSDSLMGFAHDPWVLHVVALLIIIGGLSPAVVVGVWRRRGSVPLQMRLVFWATGLLLAIGTMLFLASEWNNTLAGLSGWDKLHNAWFQSVTLRTAGFNTVDFADVRPATLTFCLLWMFIGGSPGGTAGGIKTTTAAVLALAVAATVRGRSAVAIFGRTIPDATVYRAASVATLGTLALILFILAIQLTQSTEVMPGIFEVTSALGTVGLSMGATSSLDMVGKIIIMIAMFAGRVGSLTLIVFLISQRAPMPVRVPTEIVDVG